LGSTRRICNALKESSEYHALHETTVPQEGVIDLNALHESTVRNIRRALCCTSQHKQP